jgi:hypothetical protein
MKSRQCARKRHLTAAPKLPINPDHRSPRRGKSAADLREDLVRRRVLRARVERRCGRLADVRDPRRPSIPRLGRPSTGPAFDRRHRHQGDVDPLGDEKSGAGS